LVPYSAVLEVLIRRLRVDCEWFGICEGLDSDIELGVRTKIAASMSQVGTLEESGVWEGLLMSFKAVAIEYQFFITG
jgi:hypothetical protein